jgi:hypothetical protein
MTDQSPSAGLQLYSRRPSPSQFITCCCFAVQNRRVLLYRQFDPQGQGKIVVTSTISATRFAQLRIFFNSKPLSLLYLQTSLTSIAPGAALCFWTKLLYGLPTSSILAIRPAHLLLYLVIWTILHKIIPVHTIRAHGVADIRLHSLSTSSRYESAVSFNPPPVALSLTQKCLLLAQQEAALLPEPLWTIIFHPHHNL